MSEKLKVKSEKFCRRNFRSEISSANVFLLFTFHLSLLTFSCRVPNLEKPECAAARQTVKEFYSLHFGNDMQPSKEYIEKRKKYLTDDWKFFISKNLQTKHDYFTSTEDYPKAFRIGSCETTAADKTVFQVVFFWKDDTRSEQRETKVEAIKENDKWLINRTF